MRHNLIAIAVLTLAGCNGERRTASPEPAPNESSPSSNLNTVEPPVDAEPSA